jgi:hypothetical protein
VVNIPSATAAAAAMLTMVVVRLFVMAIIPGGELILPMQLMNVEGNENLHKLLQVFQKGFATSLGKNNIN